MGETAVRFGESLKLMFGWIPDVFGSGFTVTILTICVAVAGFVAATLSEDRSYASLKRWALEKSRFARWREPICQVLDWADVRFGTPPWGRKAFFRCLSLAYLYPFLALLAGFAFGGAFGVFGEILTARGSSPLSAAGAILLSAIGFGVAIIAMSRVLIFLLGDNVARFFEKLEISRRFVNEARRVVDFLLFVAFFLCVTFLLSGALFGIGAVFVVGAIFADGTFVALVVGVAFVAFAAFVAGVAGVAVVSAVAVAMDLAGLAVVVPGGEGGAFLMFFLLLPILNALLDHGSWCVSRMLLRDLFPSRAAQRPGSWYIGGHLLADIALAIIFLVFLAAVLPAGLGLANRFGIGFPWRDLVLNGRNDPLGAGIGVSIMLASTLVPTMLHLLAGSLALVAPPVLGPLFARAGEDPSWLERVVVFLSMIFLMLLSLAGLFSVMLFLAAVAHTFAPDLADQLVWIAMGIGDYAEGNLAGGGGTGPI